MAAEDTDQSKTVRTAMGIIDFLRVLSSVE